VATFGSALTQVTRALGHGDRHNGLPLAPVSMVRICTLSPTSSVAPAALSRISAAGSVMRPTESHPESNMIGSTSAGRIIRRSEPARVRAATVWNSSWGGKAPPMYGSSHETRCILEIEILASRAPPRRCGHAGMRMQGQRPRLDLWVRGGTLHGYTRVFSPTHLMTAGQERGLVLAGTQTDANMFGLPPGLSTPATGLAFRSFPSCESRWRAHGSRGALLLFARDRVARHPTASRRHPMSSSLQDVCYLRNSA
jgi:hypothetical protein